MAQVVSCKVHSLRPKYDNLEEWFDDDENLYIGRNGRVFIGSTKKNNRRIFHYQKSKWHNPFLVRDHGLDASLIMYEAYIREKIEKDPQTFDINSLEGKNLGCWCKPNRCHGDILVRILNERNEKITKSTSVPTAPSKKKQKRA
mmetsp:Transcript_17895/g.26803  ORF Transcript_17895/g.26803 Transcript_17895/m.26803 type:complete len:144 (+) Transcript_17895:70-501(+)